jgi:hypothetical protein
MKIVSAIGVLIFVCASVSAQTLERGDNEFGFWGDFSPKATTIFEGLSEAEAEHRKFFLAAFRYGPNLSSERHACIAMDGRCSSGGSGDGNDRVAEFRRRRANFFNGRQLMAPELRR